MRPQETSPEIQRADLASALLQLMAWGQKPLEFDYLDQPERFSRGCLGPGWGRDRLYSADFAPLPFSLQ